LTYGALVVQLIKVRNSSLRKLCSFVPPRMQADESQDYEDYPEVNKQLDKMFVHYGRRVIELMSYRGYNIGTRLIEDFLARTGLQRCSTFAETAEVISKVSELFVYQQISLVPLSALIIQGSSPALSFAFFPLCAALSPSVELTLSARSPSRPSSTSHHQ
jgi:hypothetical protein